MDALRDLQYHRTLRDQVKQDVVDSGFVEVGSQYVHQLCMACLCAARTTHMLNDDTLKQYYMNILTEMQLEVDVPVLQSPRLCWECVALLRRLVRFREQVQDSYKLLQPMLIMCDKEDLFMQTSVCRPGRLSTYFAHSIDISPRGDDAQTMTADQHDDDGAEQQPVLVKKKRTNEQLQETKADPRKMSETKLDDLGQQESQRSRSGRIKERAGEPRQSVQNPLKELLQHTTFGKALLLKEGEPLTPLSRKVLVKLIVEHQLRMLPSIKDTIRQDVWTSWANEICSLFKGEHADIYYVPYRATERQPLPASGLLHNRLITHRRFLKLGGPRSSIAEKHDRRSKRVRPLPAALDSSDEDEDPATCIRWLETSSSPLAVVLYKWQASFKARHELLKEKSIDDYFSQFLCLRLPTGHQLLANDFDKAYPLASAASEEHFPLVKQRLLELLVEKGLDVKDEPAVTELLDLATVGEEQASLAALRCIPYLMKQIAPVPRKVNGKNWKPTRAEVSRAFIARVSSPDDVERCIEDRLAYTLDKGIPLGIFIIAVGPSWSAITQYEVVVTKSVRYQFSEIKAALTSAIKTYFALDIEYTVDAGPCWMFVQRTVFKIVTKFDVLYDKSVTLRELIKDCVMFS